MIYVVHDPRAIHDTLSENPWRMCIFKLRRSLAHNFIRQSFREGAPRDQIEELGKECQVEGEYAHQYFAQALSTGCKPDLQAERPYAYLSAKD